MKSTKALTYGVSILGIQAIIVIFNQLLGQVLLVLLPLPLMVYAAMFSNQEALIVWGASGIIGFIFGGFPMMISIWGYGLIGLACIYTMKKGFPVIKQYLYMLMIAVPFNIFMIYFFGEFFAIDVSELVGLFNIWIALILVGLTILMELFVLRRGFLLLNYTLKVHRK